MTVTVTLRPELKPHTVAQLVAALQEAPPTYSVIICDHGTYTGTTWTYDMRTEIDHVHKVVRIYCECD